MAKKKRSHKLNYWLGASFPMGPRPTFWNRVEAGSLRGEYGSGGEHRAGPIFRKQRRLEPHKPVQKCENCTTTYAHTANTAPKRGFWTPSAPPIWFLCHDGFWPIFMTRMARGALRTISSSLKKCNLVSIFLLKTDTLDGVKSGSCVRRFWGARICSF